MKLSKMSCNEMMSTVEGLVGPYLFLMLQFCTRIPKAMPSEVVIGMQCTISSIIVPGVSTMHTINTLRTTINQCHHTFSVHGQANGANHARNDLVDKKI